MTADSSELIQLNWNEFNPWRIQALRHGLSNHPLLDSEALIALGRRCRGTNRWYAFNNGATAATNFDEAARLYPSAKSSVEALRAIDEAKAWVLLRHIQADPSYRQLVDQVLESIRAELEPHDPGMYYRAGWIFSASPHTVTPFHVDRSHVILLQVRGVKTVYVWDADDHGVVDDRARDGFHSRHDLSRAPWREDFRGRAQVFELGPGMGVYMPLTSPHMIETHDEASTTISFTYNTHATRRIAKLHVMREYLHRLGMRPPRPGAHRIFDRAALFGASAMIALHGPGGHPPACPSLAHRHAYAVAD